MFEDDLEGISDDDIENILETDDGAAKEDRTDKIEKAEKADREDKVAVSKQPKVDALDIAWDTLRGENKEKSEDIPDNVEAEGNQPLSFFRLSVHSSVPP